MGNHSMQQNFIKDQWEALDKTVTHTLWRNRRQPNLHIEEHEKFATDEDTYNHDKDIFYFRYNNPYLVAGAFLQQNEQHQFCSSNYKSRLFIEKIPIRLVDIEHIPFPDILHLYDQCLNGFQLLAQKLSYFFQVEQSYIGVNERNVVKVWLSKYFANHNSIGGKISQQQMVKGIIDIVDKNSDPYQIDQNIPTVRNYLYRNSDTLRFEEAKRQLQSYVNTYNNGFIPKQLDCVEHAGGAYFIANRPEIYHSQQSLVQQPYQQQYIPPNKAYHAQRDQNRPQLISNTNISQADIISQGSYQNLQYMPLAPLASIPNQLNLKGSEAFPQAQRQKVIVNPAQVRQNMEVVRRRKSDYQKQFLPLPSNLPPNHMKYSQTLQQQVPLQSRHLALSRNVPVNGIIQQNISVSQPSIYNPPNLMRLDGPIRTQSSTRFIGESSQQITFKHLNQNGQIPSLPISGNPSINNFSPGPSLLNSHRAAFPSNPYIQDQTKTVSQKSLVSPLYTQIPLPESNRKQVSNSIHYNSTMLKTEPKAEKIDNTPVLYNNSSVEKRKEINYSPAVNYNPAVSEQQNQLLASFNLSFSKPLAANDYQNPFQKQYTPEVTKAEAKFDTEYSPKKSIQINPNDGKSSDQFLKKLREMNQSLGTNERQKSSFIQEISPISYSNGANYAQTFSKGFYQEANIRSYQQINTATPVQSIMQADEQQFGRNAVSNIIYNQESSYKNINAFANTEPLKFEQGIAMKYSRLEADQPQQIPFKKYPYAKYEANIDSDLMADLNKLSK